MLIKRDKYDETFSDYIRKRDKYTCQSCGRVCKIGEEWLWRLDCSHFWGRANQSVRYDEENADAHCFTCHDKFGSNPHDFKKWKENQLGQARYKALEKRARTIKRWEKGEKDEIRKMYQEKIKQL